MLVRIQKLDHNANRQQDQLEEVKGELAVVKSELAVVKGEVAEVKGQVTVVEGKFAEQVAVNTGLFDSIEENARKIAGNTVTLHQAEAQLSEVAPLRAEVTTLKAKLSGVEAQLSEVSAQFAEAQRTIAEAQRTIEKLEKCKLKIPLAVHDLNCD